MITRGVEPTPPPEPIPHEKVEELTTAAKERKQKLIARGALAALLYEETHDYQGIATVMQVTVPTVRSWVSLYKAKKREEIDTIAAQLQKTTAQLALDRIHEGLTEGETEFAAEFGRKVLKDIGHLPGPPRAGGSLGPNTVTSLTINVKSADDKASAAGTVIVDGVIVQSADGKAHSVGVPRQLTAAATDDLADPTDADRAKQ